VAVRKLSPVLWIAALILLPIVAAGVYLATRERPGRPAEPAATTAPADDAVADEPSVPPLGDDPPAPLRVDAAAAPADAWPTFRGHPSGSGRAGFELPDRLGLTWRARSPAGFVSTAAIAGGRVYVGDEGGAAYCLDLATGRQRWAFATGSVIDGPMLFDRGRVVFGTGGGRVFSLDADTGRKRWSVELDDSIASGAVAADVPDRGRCYLLGCNDGAVYCLSAADGSRVWKHQTETYVYGTPAVTGGRVTFGGCDAMLHVVNLADGIYQDSVEVGGFVVATPALAGGLAFVGHYNSRIICYDVRAGEVLWRFRGRGEPFISSAALAGDRVLVGSDDRFLYCLRLADGAPLWKFRTRGAVEGSPVVSGGKVIFGSGDGRVYLLAADDGRKLWEYDTGAALVASPAVAAGRVVVGNIDGRLLCFGPAEEAPAAAATVELEPPPDPPLTTAPATRPTTQPAPGKPQE
jgi:outer membrane protein assembly factor BamB